MRVSSIQKITENIAKAKKEGRSPVINLDLDGVVANYEEAMRAFSKRIMGEEENFPPMESYSFVESGWFDSEEMFKRVHCAAVDQGMFSQMKPIPGSIRGINRLVDAGFHIRVNTSRFVRDGQHSKVITETAKWLDDHTVRYRDISFTGIKPDIRCDVAIDDSPHNIDAYDANGVPCIVFNQAYNRSYEGTHVRLASMMDIADLLINC